MADVSDYTALLTGDYWGGIEITDHPVFVTYSFDTTAPASDASHLAGSAYATFTPFTAAQQAEAQQALANWGTNSGIVFLQAAPGQGDINFAAYDGIGQQETGEDLADRAQLIDGQEVGLFSRWVGGSQVHDPKLLAFDVADGYPIHDTVLDERRSSLLDPVVR